MALAAQCSRPGYRGTTSVLANRDRETDIKRILQYAAIAAGLWVAVQITGLDFTGSVWEFLGVALLLFLATMIVRPILKVLSFPVILLTLGLFLLVVNAVVLQLVVWLSEPDRLDLGLTSSGFFWATFLAALVISIVRAILDFFFIKD
ncbi:MAG: phage holin family protein [Acidimicrobiia bacterium]